MGMLIIFAAMKKLFLISLAQIFCLGVCCAQLHIDLKTLIGVSRTDAMKKLKDWKIKVSSIDTTTNITGYKDGIQIQLVDGKVSTIWIEFTKRRTGAFPFQVDDLIKPNTNIHKVVSHYGKPNEEGDGTKIGNTQLGKWMKWKREKFQLHCEIIRSRIVMVTIMEPDWNP